jgi:pyruvate dehydrogenase E2 component (dihydrolipoamide acetyltransferase)
MRKTIASRLTQSYQTIPHVQFTVEAAAGGLLALRKELEPLAKQEGSGLSITSLLVKLCAWAIRRHPLLNSSWMDKKIVLHADVNIGMAVALEGGLIVPVIHRADTLGLGEINRRVHANSEKARSGNLGVEEVSGGTFTISNLGMYGIDQFNALINPPECAILAVGRIRKQAVVVENPAGDEIIIAPVMNLTLSVDHRAIDGAAAAMFLRDLVSAIEKPGRIIW